MASASFEVQEPRIGGGVGVALRNVACVAPAASPASAPPPSSPCAPAHSGGALGMSYTACHAGPWTERVFETRNSAGCTRVPSRSQTSYTNAERWPVRMIMMEGRRQSLPATARHTAKHLYASVGTRLCEFNETGDTRPQVTISGRPHYFVLR